jgi:hypothetical protein
MQIRAISRNAIHRARSPTAVCSVGLCEIPYTTTNNVNILLLTLNLKEYAEQSFIFGLGFMMC